MFSQIVFFGLGISSVYSLFGHHNPNHGGVVPPEFLLPQTALNQTEVVELRRIKFLEESFFVYKKAEQIGDGVDYVTEGHNGELKVGQSFQRKLIECNAHTSGGPQAGRYKVRPIVLDIGANGGIYGLYAAYKGCQTYFFEIQPACIRNIYSSILINNFVSHANIIPHPMGNDSSSVISLDETSLCYGIYRLSTGNQHKEYQKNEKNLGKKFDAKMHTVDEVRI